jgi:hypothetical protein
MPYHLCFVSQAHSVINQWIDCPPWTEDEHDGIADEGIPTSLPSSIDDITDRVDVQHKPNDLRIGPILRARAKLLEQ